MARKKKSNGRRRHVKRPQGIISTAIPVLCHQEDFDEMSAACPSLGFPDYHAYRRQLALTLEALRREGAEIQLSPWDPGDYLMFCDDLDLDPDDRESRAVYATEPRVLAPLHDAGQPLGELLHLLGHVRADELTVLAAEAMLQREATGDELERRRRRSAEFAGGALAALVAQAGPGLHRLSVVLNDQDTELQARAVVNLIDDTVHVVRPGPDAFCDLLGAAHVLSVPAGVILRSRSHDAGAPVVIRGWRVTALGLEPLEADEVSRACRVDPCTGRIQPPEQGVSYEPAFVVPRA
ncbi:MAG: hypothetical protein ABIS86_03635 [Streptosporangiaceae bacterium]